MNADNETDKCCNRTGSLLTSNFQMVKTTNNTTVFCIGLDAKAHFILVQLKSILCQFHSNMAQDRKFAKWSQICYGSLASICLGVAEAALTISWTSLWRRLWRIFVFPNPIIGIAKQIFTCVVYILVSDSAVERRN